jgi:hypothetical protein
MTTSEASIIMEIGKPQFTIKLYEHMLKLDLKESVKNEIETHVHENNPILQKTIGHVLSMFIPLHVRLSEIDSVDKDKTGKVRINLPRHRDITMPLELKDARKLVNKLNELIPKEKEKEGGRLMEEHKLRKIEEVRREREREETTTPAGWAAFPLAQPTGVLQKEKEAENRTVAKEEQED